MLMEHAMFDVLLKWFYIDEDRNYTGGTSSFEKTLSPLHSHVVA